MNLLPQALWYAKRGHPVFPCRAGEKIPATRNGFHDASTDPDRVRAWWTANPTYNIALPTGHKFDVIDLDMPGWSVVNDGVVDDLCPGEWIGVAATPRGGCHIYIPPTGAGNAAGMLPGMDYRGRGGYVLAAPSMVNGNPYVWKDPPKW